MAEIPSSLAPPAIPSFTSELRVAVVAGEPAPAPEPVLVEAPANLRGAAIAKMQADKIRKPTVENKPCWDRPTCREVQLGIPSPVPGGSVRESSAIAASEASAGASAEPVTEPSTEPSTKSSAESSAESSTEVPTETPTETSAETSVETPSEQPADAPPEAPVETSTEQPPQGR
jgi:hypothetical protein